MMDAVNRAIQAAQMDLLSKQMNMQNQAYFQQQAQLAAQQAQQQAYGFGWHDPSALQAQVNQFHLAGDLMDVKPKKTRLRVPLYMYMIFVALSCIALGIFLKLQGM